MNKNDIFYGTRIFKERVDECEKEDIGWVKDSELPNLIAKVRFSLKDVTSWEEWVELQDIEPYYKTETSSKIRIYLEGGLSYTLIISIDKFDKIMEEYISRKGLIKSN